MHLLRLFLISLKSPLYSSVIFGGISPLLMRSTYSAATFSGPITASSVSFTPVTMPLNSKFTFSGSPRVASCPFTAASASLPASPIRVRIIPLTLDMKYNPRAIANKTPTAMIISIMVRADAAIALKASSASSAPASLICSISIRRLSASSQSPLAIMYAS